jgi:hypothetical protein
MFMKREMNGLMERGNKRSKAELKKKLFDAERQRNNSDNKRTKADVFETRDEWFDGESQQKNEDWAFKKKV